MKLTRNYLKELIQECRVELLNEALDKDFKSKKYSKLSSDQQMNYIKKSIPKINDDELGDFLDVYDLFNGSMASPPEDPIERKEAKRMGKEYWQTLKKYPELKKLGFNDDDINVSWF